MVTEAEWWSFERTRIELFYRQARRIKAMWVAYVIRLDQNEFSLA